MRIITLLVLFTLSIVGCGKPTTTTVTTSPDYRWMDRNIYFAYSQGGAANANRNNEFQKQKVKDALIDIANRSNLGSNYFNFINTDEARLTPILTATTSSSEFKSFILILPDADFSDYVVNQLGGTVPDPNAVTVLNSAYKRQFFMIIKASCFSSDVACNGITSASGLRALVARQIGLMTGMPLKKDSATCASLSPQLKTQTLCPCTYQTTTTNTVATLNGSVNAGSNIVTLSSAPAADYSGDYIVGTGIPASTTISSTSASSLNLAQQSTLTAVNVNFSVQTYSFANSFDVMCSNTPDDSQWSPSNRDAWVSSFNNILEAILNNPNFYTEYQPATK
jgi:hypothetical protein